MLGTQQKKKTFHLGARSIYLAYGKALLKTVPLANKVIKHTNFLALNYNSIERQVQSLRYLSGQVPEVVADVEKSSLIDEWHLFMCGDCEEPLSVDERVDVYWAKVLSLKSSPGRQKYPLMSKLIKGTPLSASWKC
ncbi:hypothetical protein HPB48_018323 [Haemaphysalis longicornis]|uniref:Uncharacterized protein n=1 Tax=Haemaphysalis longicornis TaxID=44386 RepID=A0A9J6GI99_HAELO|nr:hypothetical protein HPB48_018323 [Haemaphysalis longicornis]